MLKGARTLIAEAVGRGHVCPLDVPALAVGGTGDVLSGVIAALLSDDDRWINGQRLEVAGGAYL